MSDRGGYMFVEKKREKRLQASGQIRKLICIKNPWGWVLYKARSFTKIQDDLCNVQRCSYLIKIACYVKIKLCCYTNVYSIVIVIKLMQNVSDILRQNVSLYRL